MWDQKLEDRELAYLKESIQQQQLTKDSQIANEIVRMIHTSLFGYKRCKHVQLDNKDMIALANTILSKPIAKHYTKAVNKYVLTHYLECRFNDNINDVEYYIYTDGFEHIKYKHHKKVVGTINRHFINCINDVRQKARIHYRILWKKYREQLKEEGVI